MVAAALCAGLSALLTASCGIITAGVSLPEAFTHNGNLGLQGQLVDDRGMPVDEVIVELTRDYYLWHADGSYTETTHLTYAADHDFNITPMRAEVLSFKFKKPGYVDAEISVDIEGIKQNTSDFIAGGRWPLNTPVRLVMPLASNPLPPLTRVAVPLDYTDPAVTPMIDLAQAKGEVLKATYSANAVRPLNAGEQPPALSVFAEVERQPLKTIGKDRQVDPLDINLPAKFTLRVGDAAGGFQEFTPMAGCHPFSQMPLAPEEGYTAGLTLESARLRLMRDSKREGMTERNVFFYVKAGGQYGKGLIRWGTNAEEKLSMLVVLMMQPDGSRNVPSIGFSSNAERAR